MLTCVSLCVCDCAAETRLVQDICPCVPLRKRGPPSQVGSLSLFLSDASQHTECLTLCCRVCVNPLKQCNQYVEDIDEMSLDAEDLLSFSYQVAKGMEYITSKNVSVLQTVGLICRVVTERDVKLLTLVYKSHHGSEPTCFHRCQLMVPIQYSQTSTW